MSISTGSIPTEIAALVNLESFAVNDNQLNGKFAKPILSYTCAQPVPFNEFHHGIHTHRCDTNWNRKNDQS